jgi:stearoyl-CoA desaturase (delta-9 desaturase)
MTDLVAAASPPQRARWSLPLAVHHALNLAPMLLVHLGAAAIFLTGGSLFDWLLFALLLYLRGLCVVVGYHRYFSHRSFKTSRLAQFVLACCCCATLQQGPLWWALYHRLHHRHADRPGDPHSPHQGGFWWAYCGWLFVPLQPDWRGVGDLRRFPELVWLERFWQLPGLLLAGLCWWVGGWSLLCVAFCLSAVVTFNMAFVINTLTHQVGTRRFPTADQSRNSFWLAVLTLGDGWHNNHHHYPGAAQAGFFRGEVDGAYDVIVVLEFLGLVWDVRRVPAHKLRAVVEPAAPEVAVAGPTDG